MKLRKPKLQKLNNGKCIAKYYQDALDKAKKEYPCIKTINYCCGCCCNRQSALKCCWKNYKKVDLTKILNPWGYLQDNMCCICLWWNYPNEHDCDQLKNERSFFSSCCWTTEGKKYQEEIDYWRSVFKKT